QPHSTVKSALAIGLRTYLYGPQVMRTSGSGKWACGERARPAANSPKVAKPRMAPATMRMIPPTDAHGGRLTGMSWSIRRSCQVIVPMRAAGQAAMSSDLRRNVSLRVMEEEVDYGVFTRTFQRPNAISRGKMLRRTGMRARRKMGGRRGVARGSSRRLRKVFW